MVKVYPPFVNYFEMTKETVLRCDRDVPRFHAFLKVKNAISTNKPAHRSPVLITVSQRQMNVCLVRLVNVLGSLSTRVFETRTATGREHFAC